MLKKLYLLGFIIYSTIFFGLTPFKVYADDTSLGRCSEGVYPIEHRNIQMVDEEVLIKLKDQEVTCTFTFKNTGPTEKVLMGFPAIYSGEYLEVGSFGEDAKSNIKDFKTYVNGKEIPVKLEELASEKINESLEKQSYIYKEWYTFDVVIKKDETVKVVNSYGYKPAHTSMVPTEILEGYILDTGAAWKDGIGHGKIIFDLQGIPFTFIGYPTLAEYCRLEDERLIYEFWDFEPTQNIEFLYWDTSEWDEDYAKEIGSYDKVKEREELYKTLVSAKSQEVQELIKEAIEQNDVMSLLYLKSRSVGLTKDERKPYLYNVSFINNEIDISIGDVSGDLQEVYVRVYDAEDQENFLKEYDMSQEGYRNTLGFGSSFGGSKRLPKDVDNPVVKIYAKDEEGNELRYCILGSSATQSEMMMATEPEKRDTSKVMEKEAIEASAGKAKTLIAGLTPREAGLTGLVIILFLTLVMQQRKAKE